MVVTRPVRTSALGSTRRSGTTTWRGEMLPAAASGRKGWYVMYDRGSTTVTVASAYRIFFRMRRAAYRPTYPPPTTRILGRSVVLMPSSIHLPQGGTSCAPSQAPAGGVLSSAARLIQAMAREAVTGALRPDVNAV